MGWHCTVSRGTSPAWPGLGGHLAPAGPARRAAGPCRMTSGSRSPRRAGSRSRSPADRFMGVCHPPGRMQQPVKHGSPCSASGGQAVSQALTCETARHHRTCDQVRKPSGRSASRTACSRCQAGLAVRGLRHASQGSSPRRCAIVDDVVRRLVQHCVASLAGARSAPHPQMLRGPGRPKGSARHPAIQCPGKPTTKTKRTPDDE
jgi:hypothetical protein